MEEISKETYLMKVFGEIVGLSVIGVLVTWCVGVCGRAGLLVYCEGEKSCFHYVFLFMVLKVAV